MPTALSAEALDPLIGAEPELVQAALRAIYDQQAEPLDLDGVAAAGRGIGKSPGQMLAMILDEDDLAGPFVAFLAARNHPLDAEAFTDMIVGIKADMETTLGPIVGIAFDEAKLARFSLQSRGFRCRIKVNGRIMGSGALISPRLVITADHVIEKPEGSAGDPVIEVIASDGLSYPARVAFALPPHENERTGKLPPVTAAATHCDVALLRLDHALGRRYAQAELPPAPVACGGKGPFILVHFPGGKASGISFGEVERTSADDLRQAHTAKAANGSSGGPGFDAEFRFIGLHQGILGRIKRIVPFDRFAANDDFRAALQKDREARFLWSLDGSPDGHIVIGRQDFFDALTAMVEGDAPALKGIWVRRQNIALSTGLSFSHEMLVAFLDGDRAGHRVFRIPTGFDVPDLIAEVHRQAFDAGAAGATPGVQEHETTRVAHDEDRARTLAGALEEAAIAAGETWWFFLDNPPSGLLHETQVQLEHLVRALLARPHLRLVLSGFETYELVEQMFETVAEARAAALPGLLAEHVGEFGPADVRLTAAEMSRAMGYGWSADVIDRIVKLALAGLPASGGRYAAEHVGAVAEKLRDEARREEGIT
ncbi:MAG: hypothetical protein B7Z02_03260 [Rhodobacterales bacterium 32-67-9]|nr:MAG: hypothetical protein B7Z02_03260 [Rhodobacterales bacterium 32-67-9]